MSERAALIDEINSLPFRYYNEVVDFVEYIKEKKQKNITHLKKPQKLRLTNTLMIKS